MKIFISYGHDRYSVVAKAFKYQFEKDGHQVWFDESNIHPTKNWQHAIEEGILSADWVLVLMSEHSMRRPDGVCLDELSYARFLNKPIAPVMVEQVSPPLVIARIQWLDMTSILDESNQIEDGRFLAYYHNIKSIMESNHTLSFQGELATLKSVLKPINESSQIVHLAKDFTGRQKLVQTFDQWLADKNNRVFWLTGYIGSGKSAFAAHLIQKHPSIACYHFFKRYDQELSDTCRAICSIAYYLSTQLIEYANFLAVQDLSFVENGSIETIFRKLLVEPFTRLNIQITEPKVIILDGLDEISEDHQQEFCRLFFDHVNQLPLWMKILITSRPNVEILRSLDYLVPYKMEQFAVMNMDDVATYVHKQLHQRSLSLDLGREICRKSEGNFLYAKLLVTMLEKDRGFDITSIPKGFNNIYSQVLKQRVSLNQYNELVRPFLGLYLIKGPNGLFDSAQRWLKLKRREISLIKDILSPFFYEEISNQKRLFKPYHSGFLEWVTSEQHAGSVYTVFIEDVIDELYEHISNSDLRALTFEEFKDYLMIIYFKQNKGVTEELIHHYLNQLHAKLQEMIEQIRNTQGETVDPHQYNKDIYSALSIIYMLQTPSNESLDLLIDIYQVKASLMIQHGAQNSRNFEEGVRSIYRLLALLTLLPNKQKQYGFLKLTQEVSWFAYFIKSGISHDLGGEISDVIRPEIYKLSVDCAKGIEEQEFVKDWMTSLKNMYDPEGYLEVPTSRHNELRYYFEDLKRDINRVNELIEKQFNGI